MDQSNAITKRNQNRARVLLAAKLEISGRELPVMMRNLSADGALVEGDVLPVEGCNVLFHKNDLVVPGRVAWSRGRRAGISFAQPLNPELMLRHAPPPPPRHSVPQRGADSGNLALDAERLALQSIWGDDAEGDAD